MSWRLPPPIWIGSRRQTLLGTLLHFGAIAWRLTKWCVGAGVVLALLRRLTTGIAAGWSGAAWVAACAWLLFLWERYGLVEAALPSRGWPRWAAAAALAIAAGAGTWAVARFAGPLVITALGLRP